MKTLGWEEIRAFFIRRKWFRKKFGEDVFDSICDRNTIGLSVELMRELSVWIDGYRTAKPDRQTVTTEER